MTRDNPLDGEITSESALNEALGRLLRTAYRNDVDVEGGWECRNGDEAPDWEAVVVEIEKDGDGIRS